jgi:Methyltransferase domain
LPQFPSLLPPAAAAQDVFHDRSHLPLGRDQLVLLTQRHSRRQKVCITSGWHRYRKQCSKADPFYHLPLRLSWRVGEPRLDYQHEVFRTASGNKWLYAPFPPAKGSIVSDCGTGTGAWIRELADKHPDLTFEALDLTLANFYKSAPSNVKPLATNIFSDDCPLAKEPGTRAFINQRLMLSAFTKAQWQAVLKRYYDALQPGGWLQLGEIEAEAFGEGIPTIKRWMTLAGAIAEKREIFFFCAKALKGMMEEVGFVDVQTERCALKMGDKVPTLPMTSPQFIRATMDAVGSMAPKLGLVTEEERQEILEEVYQICNSHPDLEYPLLYTWGRKPE